jgi:hypothetical protein
LKIENGNYKNTMPRPTTANIATREQKDSAGRYLLDHLVDIGENAPEKRGAIRVVFRDLVAKGYQWSCWSVDAAIRTHNHKLLDSLMSEIESSEVFRATYALIIEALSWTAVHSRNAYALRYANITAEHWEEIALMDDTRFLGRMLTLYHARHYERTLDRPRKVWEPALVDVGRFAGMLAQEYDAGRDGFRWLLRNGFIDGDSVNEYQRAQIEARYGRKALKALN